MPTLAPVVPEVTIPVTLDTIDHPATTEMNDVIFQSIEKSPGVQKRRRGRSQDLV